MNEHTTTLDELRSERRWVAFINVPKENGDMGKPPVAVCGPDKGRLSNKNRDGWGTYDEAAAFARSGACVTLGSTAYPIAGVGLQLGSGLAGIDLDHVHDAQTGELTAEASDIVQRMNSYTEISPSGTGLHILCLVSPETAIGKNRKEPCEMYTEGRYFTVTGKPYGPASPIAERTAAFLSVYTDYVAPTQAKAETALRTREWTAQAAESFGGTLSDAEVLERMCAAKNGAAMRALYDGDTSAYGGDQSRADLALCRALAWWTNGDIEQMDRMFRGSGLMRDKWDTVHYSNGSTYGTATLNQALDGFYRDGGKGYRATSSVSTEKSVQRTAGAAGTQLPEIDEKPLVLDLQSTYLQNKFDEDTKRFSAFAGRKSGFANLDAITSIYPGVYALGAVSALGKTTFALQLADQMAADGVSVLYFSLEQNRMELLSKSLSRLMYQADPKEACESFLLRRGYQHTSVLREECYTKAVSQYAATGTPYVCECPFATTPKQIITAVESFMNEHGEKAPVVVVDYLQALTPVDPRVTRTPREAADAALREFKDFQKATSTTFLVISSFNRGSYLSRTSFESFKESGGIEYTCDVVWGMDPAVMYDTKTEVSVGKQATRTLAELFLSDGNLEAKAKAVKDYREKGHAKRGVVLSCLKDRNGRNYSIAFQYRPGYDLFTPDSGFSMDDENGTEGGAARTPKRR